MSGPDAERARRDYAAHEAGYDASAQRPRALRLRTSDKLRLARGDAVLDVACGTGLSFAPLVEGIGAHGRLTGVELSPEMAGLARQRAERAGWRNVRVDIADMASARLDGPYDAVLLHFTHDVLRTPGALEAIVAACKPGARIAVAGSKLLPWWLAPLNAWVRRINAPYMTTFEGLERPWAPLERHVPDLRRESALGGIAYLAWGTVRR